MQTLELQKMGLIELGRDECVEVNGGSSPWGWALQQAILHFDEIVKGLEAGWNFDKKPKTK
ncbi:MAG: hypothetical protein EOO02_14255 [Chitinophagaceae bacterium]|nr:MAG: hypothetical protein EOO02_14255 [Chitinophagaceae bacterium]